jgi:hypothetical protein
MSTSFSVFPRLYPSRKQCNFSKEIPPSGERDGIAIFEQERETSPELDDKAGAELAREINFNEAGIGTFQRLRRAGGVTGHSAQCGSPRGLE